MTLYEQILELFPLTSYEDERKSSGDMTFLKQTERRNLAGGGSTTVVLRENDGSFAVTNVPSGPPAPDMPAAEPFGDSQARIVADAILIIE